MNIHVGVRPAALREWIAPLVEAGFEVRWQETEPMHVLELGWVLADEGLANAVRILFNLIRKPVAGRQVISMQRMFRRYARQLKAIALVAEKPVS